MVSDEQDPDRRRQTQRGSDFMRCISHCQAGKADCQSGRFAHRIAEVSLRLCALAGICFCTAPASAELYFPQRRKGAKEARSSYDTKARHEGSQPTGRSSHPKQSQTAV